MNLSDVSRRIKLNYGELSVNDQKQQHTELCISESHASTLNLLYNFARGKFYLDVKRQHSDDFNDYVITVLNISPRQVRRYIQLFYLVTNYKRLLVARKPFSDIVYFASEIEKVAVNDPHVKVLIKWYHLRIEGRW